MRQPIPYFKLRLKFIASSFQTLEDETVTVPEI